MCDKCAIDMELNFEQKTYEKNETFVSTLEAFNDLYITYSDAVYANIRKLVKSTNDAEDILQDVFITLWENQHKLSKHSIRGWLFVVSHNKALDYLKRYVKFSIDELDVYQDIADLSPDGKEIEETYLEQMRMIVEAMDTLPYRKKQVFQLCRLDGLTKEEVALRMGISSQSVTDYLKQSHRAIRTYILAKYPYAVATGGILLILSFS